MWKHSDSYKDRLQTMLRGMLNQGLGHASGPHSSFIPYHVDAITLQPFGNGWQDEMAMGRVIESTFRSLNNLLEHLHQSFFFYLLMQANRFVSIGTYLPSAMLVAVNFTIMAIYLWVKSGTPIPSTEKFASTEAGLKKPSDVIEKGDAKALVPKDTFAVLERELFLPLAIVAGSQFLGVVPLYIFNHTPQSVSFHSNDQGSISHNKMLLIVFVVFAILNNVLSPILSILLTTHFKPTSQQYMLIKSFSLLLLGMFLSSLATLNFSLAFLVGLLSSPLTWVQPMPNRPIFKVLVGVLLTVISPTVILASASWAWGLGIVDVLKEAAFGWDVWGMNTQVVVWCVWWPAWVVGGVLLWGRPADEKKSPKGKVRGRQD
jgi:glycosylphosphatidylinositol transamidase